MNDRFKFRAVLKTNDFVILVQPYYILEDSYFIDLNVVEIEFENKYPNDCFWDFIEEIKKQDYIQEISTDGDLIITRDFTNLMQCTGLKDKNGKLIYEGDIVRFKDNITINGSKTHISVVEHNEAFNTFMYHAECKGLHTVNKAQNEQFKVEVIGNIYENIELLEVNDNE